MRTSVSVDFKQFLLARICKTYARCWKVSCKNGTIKGFTTHTRDVTISGVPYISVSGLTTSSVKASEGLSVDNLSISAFLANADEHDILKGIYDGATVEVFLFNYFDLGMGKMTEKIGFLGEITRADGVFQAEVRGLMDMLRTRIGRTYTAACNARLGDVRCGAVITPTAAAVTAVPANKTLILSNIGGFPDHWFTQGYLTVVTGDNDGLVRDVRSHVGSTVELYLATPFAWHVGDTVNVFPGCDRTKRTCIDKFNNVVNFRGFDFVPTLEQVYDSPINLSPDPMVCAVDDPGYADQPVNEGGAVPDSSGSESDSGGGGDSGGDSGC